MNGDKDFIKGVYTTLLSPDGRPVRLLRIPHSEALALNSRDRVPFMFLYYIMLYFVVFVDNWELFHSFSRTLGADFRLPPHFSFRFPNFAICVLFFTIFKN